MCVLPDANKRLQLKYFIIWARNYLFLKKKYVTSEGAVSLNMLYYQQLSNACFQGSFYANNDLSIVQFL